MGSSTAELHVTDSVTRIDGARGAVLVSGSHAGETAALFVAAAGVRATVLNDAGIGRDGAGVAGLALLDSHGIAAAAVDTASARIGDGADTLARGIVSTVNDAAAAAGVEPGQTAQEAVRRLTELPTADAAGAVVVPEARAPFAVDPELPAVLAFDSASQIGPEHAGRIAITGSHGGLVAGRALKVPMFAATFNDAGVGCDRAGIGRLALLDREHVAALTVAHTSARIGDALDSWERGAVSHTNLTAAAAGVVAGQPVRVAIRLLAAAREELECRS